MSDLANLSVEEIFRLLESNNPDVVSEIQRFFHENLSETREGWLVSGLYEYYTNTGSPNGLKLLLNVKEPHDRLLCDRLAEGLRTQDKGRTIALDMFGYIVRKQPTWLHRVAQHQLFKDLLKLIKIESDVVVVVPSLLVLVSLLPTVSAKLANFLTELFDIFIRLCTYKWKEGPKMPELSCTHLMVAIYAYFQRLYGMFPCNFLYFLRQQFLDTSPSAGSPVFNDIVSPLLATVRLHPLLVTQNRDHEKTTGRWKGLGEVHDIVAECSRFSLDIYESASREDLGFLSLWPQSGDAHTPLPTPNSSLVRIRSPSVNSSMNLNVALSSKPPGEKKLKDVTNANMVLDSPPEAAVEATPDNTPYATPVKDSPLRHQVRSGPAPHVKNLSFKSPGPASPTKLFTSPTKESSPFRFPDPSEGRDSLFAEVPVSSLSSKRDSLGLGLPNLSSLSSRMKSIASDRGEVDSSGENILDTRPSPVKFTAQPQLQVSPVKPNAENLGSRYNMDRTKLLSLPLDGGDPNNEETDGEVSLITGSAGEKLNLSTRHITPHIFPESAGGSSCTSRALSRLSIGSPKEDQDTETVSTMSASGTPSSLQPSVDELVRKVRTRVRCITLCEPSETLPSPKTLPKAVYPRKLSRSSSCPDISEMDSSLTKASIVIEKDKGKLRFTSGTQTDYDLAILPYEHLFPSALPLPTAVAAPNPLPPPNQLLDQYLEAAVASCNSNQKDLNSQLQLLRVQLQFETGRREVLGSRNRRLLGYTKNVRELEELNLSLVDKLNLAQQEIATLHTQLSAVRSGKHQAETERAESGKLQDKMIQELQSKVQELTTSNRELSEKYEREEMIALDALASCDKARSELFQAQAKLNIYKKKEENWKVCEAELNKSKTKLLLQGELVVRQKEKLEMLPKAGNKEELKQVQQAALNEVSSCKAELLRKSQELTVANARITELESRNNALDQGVKSLKDTIQEIHEEHKERLEAVESRQKAVRSVNIHLESTILELQERLERLMRHRGKGAGPSPSSDSLDMMAMSHMSSSLVGSLGSETGDHIMRAMDSPPVNIGREIIGLEIPISTARSVGVDSAYSVGVGSAHSVLHREFGSGGSGEGGENGHSH